MSKRTNTIDNEILQVLKDCGNYLLPEESLTQQVMISVRPPPSLAEITERVRALEASLCVIGSLEDDVMKWKVTQRGLVKLQEMRI
jgi:hypothetical protein